MDLPRQQRPATGRRVSNFRKFRQKFRKNLRENLQKKFIEPRTRDDGAGDQLGRHSDSKKVLAECQFRTCGSSRPGPPKSACQMMLHLFARF